MCGDRRAITSAAMLRIWMMEWLRRKEKVELKLWLMESPAAGYSRGENKERQEEWISLKVSPYY
jgi:hypothetical protein